MARTPANFRGGPVPEGIFATWDADPEARTFEVRVRLQGQQDWQNHIVSGPGYWETWVLANMTWEFQVRASVGDLDPADKSAWTAVKAWKADPKTAPGPNNVAAAPVAGGLRVTWTAVTGYAVDRYQAIAHDTDNPSAFLVSVGVRGTSATITGLVSGHRYLVSVVTWTDIGGGFPAVGPTVAAG